MQLIGHLDSPYVRRVAISLDALGISFEHVAVSVFDDFGKFKKINPILRAPTLICDNGSVLADSSIILKYVDRVYTDRGSLWQAGKTQQESRTLSLALTACNQSVQIIHKQGLTRRNTPRMKNLRRQFLASVWQLETEVRIGKIVYSSALTHSTIATVVAWSFIQSMLAEAVPLPLYPNLQALAEKTEALKPFRKYSDWANWQLHEARSVGPAA